MWPPKRGLCSKKSGRLGATGVRSSSRPYTLKILVIHPVFMDKNRRVFADFAMKNLFVLVFTPKFAHFRIKTFFSVFIPEFVEFCAYFVMKTFSMVFTLEFEEKSFCAPPPKKLFMPHPLQSHYFGAGPARPLHFLKKSYVDFCHITSKKKKYEVQS